jgi:hypothetical protein
MPLSILQKVVGISRSFRKPQVQVTISEGVLKIDSWRCSGAITVGPLPDPKVDLPVDASTVDTLALAELLSPDQLVNEGLHRRVQEAREVASDAISKATLALKPLGISREQVHELVDKHVRQVSSGLAKTLAKGTGDSWWKRICSIGWPSPHDIELAKRWEAVEDALRRDSFVELFAHIRMIYERDKPRIALEDGFPDFVTPFNEDADVFVSDLLEPVSDAYALLNNTGAIQQQFGAEADRAVRSL